MKINKKYLILGAGCSGLAFASHLKNDDFLIVEKEKEIGGYCRTVIDGEYVWDYAGHFFHFASKKWRSFFESKIKQNELVSVKKNTKIYYNDRYIDFPFQKNIHQLEKEEFINCLYDLYHRKNQREYHTFKQMLYGNFGNSISEKFLIPYNEKLYACDLDSLDSNAMGRFFPYAEIEDIIDNMKVANNDSYNNSFLYPKKGAIVFINALSQDLKKENIILNEEVITVDKENQIAYTKNHEIHYEKLINTIPLKYFLKMLKVNDCEKKLKCNKVLVFNLGFDKKSKINDIHWMYFPDKSINFYRVGFYDNILNSDKLSMYIEIGYKENDEVNVQEQLNLTLKNLKKVGIIDEHQLKAYHFCIMKPAYVHLSLETKKYLKIVKKNMENNNIYTIGRYGSWQYCSIEDCLIEADKLFEFLSEK